MKAPNFFFFKKKIMIIKFSLAPLLPSCSYSAAAAAFAAAAVAFAVADGVGGMNNGCGKSASSSGLFPKHRWVHV